MPVKSSVDHDDRMRIDEDAEAYRLGVAAEIKRRRIDAALSMNRLGENAGLSQPMIGLIERGIHMPSVSTLFRIARSLGTTPAELLASVEKAVCPTRTKPSAALAKMLAATPSAAPKKKSALPKKRTKSP